MNVCHMEAMKEIRALEEKKAMLLSSETEGFRVSYKEGESKVDTGYSYEDTRREIAEIDARIREIRSKIALANCTVRLEGFDATIGEGLVMLAQWNAEYERLSYMCRMQQKTRRITANGVLEYTECLFDVARVEAERDELRRKIGSLQVAIDRANLTSYVEI